MLTAREGLTLTNREAACRASVRAPSPRVTASEKNRLRPAPAAIDGCGGSCTRCERFQALPSLQQNGANLEYQQRAKTLAQVFPRSPAPAETFAPHHAFGSTNRVTHLLDFRHISKGGDPWTLP
jgi:hypothetical protein